MSQPVRVIVVNTDEQAAPELRALLLSVEGVRIVAEIDEPALLSQALSQFPAEVLLVHLDPNPGALMDTVAPHITEHKDHLAAIGLTEDRDAELVMRAMRMGMRELLWKPFPPEQLRELLQRVAREAPAAGRRVGRLFSVVGVCGGVGATTIAANLSVELAQLEDWAGGNGRPKVAVVDLDFRFGQVATYLDAQPTYSIADLCDSPEHIERQLIDRVMLTHPTGVQVLAHPRDLESAQRISAGQCAGVLAALLEHYDFVVVDGPVRFDASAQAVFDMTETYLLVLQLLVPPVRNADRLLGGLASGGYNLDHVQIVCNRFGRDSGHLLPADVETTLGRKLAFCLPDDWKTASTAVNVGATLFESAPKSKLRLALAQMAQALARGPAGQAGDTASPTDEKEDDGEPRRKRRLPFFAGKPG